MRHGSLFSGIGGFDLAAQWMGWENVFQVENDSFCQKVLEKNFPDTKRYGDIKEFDGTKYRGAIDVLSGGFPCQSFSLAGKGAIDLTLWKEMFRVVGEIRPPVIVAENVYGILARKKGMALSAVYSDLENEGYQTMPPVIIPACAKGAPHRRDRVWIVAYRNGEPGNLAESERRLEEIDIVGDGRERAAANSLSSGLEIRKLKSNGKECQAFIRSDNQWKNWPTKPGVCGRNDGIQNRVDRIKSLGNSIVPQVAYEIFKAIESIKKVIYSSDVRA